METRANYVLIGGFTLAVAVFALLFGLWAGKFASEDDWNEYIIRFTQAVTGVSVGSPVLYNGLNVGQIVDLQLNQEDLREVVVTIHVDSRIPLHEDTEAGIRLMGLTGLAAIQLSGGAPESPVFDHRPGQPPPELKAVESPLHRLMESSEGMFVTANNILVQMQKILSDENIGEIDETLTSLRIFSGTLAEQRDQFASLIQQAEQAGLRLNSVLENADGTLTEARALVGQIDQELIAALPQITDGLEQTLAQINSLAARADAIVASNQEALMDVGTTGLSQLGPGLEELRKLVRELSILAESIGEDPSGFLLGSQAVEEYQPQ